MTVKRFGLATVAAVAGTHALSGCNTAGGACDPAVTKEVNEGLVHFRPDGGVTESSCSAFCLGSTCHFVDAGLLRCAEVCIGGRLPSAGLALRPAYSAGAWLARMAELEGAAVVAFEQLAAELTAHGLPSFARAALQAALDEVGHATELTRLALGFGAAPTHRQHALPPVRPLEEVALDNAGEGCGRELFGTLVNLHQAQAATDARVRAAMGRIARDEAAHARMSFALADALMPRLTLAQRRRAREAQERTVTAMAREELPEAAARQLGLMDERQLKVTADAVLTRARV